MILLPLARVLTCAVLLMPCQVPCTLGQEAQGAEAGHIVTDCIVHDNQFYAHGSGKTHVFHRNRCLPKMFGTVQIIMDTGRQFCSLSQIMSGTDEAQENVDARLLAHSSLLESVPRDSYCRQPKRGNEPHIQVAFGYPNWLSSL